MTLKEKHDYRVKVLRLQEDRQYEMERDKIKQLIEVEKLKTRLGKKLYNEKQKEEKQAEKEEKMAPKPEPKEDREKYDFR